MRPAYRFAVREKLLSLGSYPEVSLAEARQRRNAARASFHQALAVKAAAHHGELAEAAAVSAALTAWMSRTCSIANDLACGFISFAALKLPTGRAQGHVAAGVVAALLLARFVFMQE